MGGIVKRRDWTAARDKCEAENNRCRVCKKVGVDAAHVIPRSRNGTEANMSADAIIPLCRFCHNKQHLEKLDILPYLTLDEQVMAVRNAGGLVTAYRYTTGDRV